MAYAANTESFDQEWTKEQMQDETKLFKPAKGEIVHF
jgi:hypothetical protein